MLAPPLPGYSRATLGVLSILSVDSVNSHSSEDDGVMLSFVLLVIDLGGRSCFGILEIPIAINPRTAKPITPTHPPAALAVEACPTRGPVGPVSTIVFFFTMNPMTAAPIVGKNHTAPSTALTIQAPSPAPAN